METIWNTFDSQYYLTATHVFTRLLGVIYFFAFFPFIFQIKGLLGHKGILPIETYLQFIWRRFHWKGYYYVPSLFWFNSTDRALLTVVIVGMILSVLLALNVYPLILIPLLYILYLSIISTGQDFLGFGWEIFLMEVTCNAFFLNVMSPPNPLVWVSINLLLFRFHFQAGISKFLSRDKNWRNMTALCYHYETQPLPNMQAWFFHQLPMWIHKGCCAMMFFVELVVPFAIFAPQEVRLAVWVLLAGLQVSIWFTGNLSYLNHFTFVFCTILVGDTYFKQFFGISVETPPTTEILPIAIASMAGTILIFLQCISLWNYFLFNRTFYEILERVQPFHIANRYGIFAVMTTKRYEIIVEGSEDGKEWKEYMFRYKPSELNRHPRRVSPYQPRLDWQAWFLPFRNYEQNLWFQLFLQRLLEGSKDVVGLMRYNPFPNHPPQYIRAVAYDYKFSDWKSLWKNGVWWQREYVGLYSPVLHLEESPFI